MLAGIGDQQAARRIKRKCPRGTEKSLQGRPSVANIIPGSGDRLNIVVERRLRLSRQNRKQRKYP